MALKLVLLAALLWICPVFTKPEKHLKKLEQCFSRKDKLNIVVDDQSNSIVNSQNISGIVPNLDGDPCIIFLPKNKTLTTKRFWPNMEKSNGTILLHLSKSHLNKRAHLLFLNGTHCNDSNIWEVDRWKTLEVMDSKDIFQNSSGSCEMVYVNVTALCTNSGYNKEYCSKVPQVRNRYIVSVQKKECHWCTKPVKPEKTVSLDTETTPGETFDSSKANEVMASMHSLACSITESSVALSGGHGVEGVLVRETEPDDVEGVAFGYSLNDSMSVTSNKEDALAFQRSIIVPKEAFEQAISQNISVPFVAVVRFPTLEKDEMDSTLIGEPFAIEMGASINNLTECINLNYKDLKYEGIPSCRSWNGQGARPNWTDEGCETFHDGNNITCSCSHLTFFAVLLTPLNATISTSNLSNLTIITKVGCAVSVIFLCVILFMHHLLRRTKVSVTAKLIIQLAYAVLLLDLTFLVNEYVAGLNSQEGCVVMAAVMHWSLLATFTWFSVQALHLCLQLYKGGTVAIRHYFLKVSLASWVLPGIPVVVLLCTRKYGQQVNISEATQSASFCWITDGNAHYIVNIGYYVLVFLVTFTTFIIIMSFHYHVWRAQAGTEQADKSTRHVASLMGMCCILGITWGFAFFAYGVLQIPSYYIFTILNSFQGFFLFLYYYNTRQSDRMGGDANSQSVITLKITEDANENPYENQQQKQ